MGHRQGRGRRPWGTEMVSMPGGLPLTNIIFKIIPECHDGFVLVVAAAGTGSMRRHGEDVNIVLSPFRLLFCNGIRLELVGG